MPAKRGLETEKLNIGYRSDILKDISLMVKPGCIVTLIGPNGCGKTTLLKTITGQLRKRNGVVYLNGQDRDRLKADSIAKQMSMVMTQRIRPELMTCRQVVQIGRYPYTGNLGILSEEDKRIVNQSMEWTDTADFADEFFQNVSDGQRQRVLLARAICQEPDILILDEPTSYLDIRHKLDLLQRIVGFAKDKNVALLMSLHELQIARNISDIVVAVGEGKVLKTGTPEEVFTEGFIRSLYHIEGMSTDILGSMPWRETDDTDKGSSEFTPRGRAKTIMIQGTMSNVGKSLIAAGLCRIFSDDGYMVAPFKSQNMALNSYITEEGLEMGRAQVMQAECARVQPLSCMNPILLKPASDTGSQVIVNGKVIGNMTGAEYFSHKTEYMKDIVDAYDRLSEMADIVVVEGAGSPVELNLKKDDIVNMGLAGVLDTPVLLVGDIDRGGVFAQLLGTLDLLTQDERDRVCGLIVNKFRGDRTLFEDGVRILEERSKKKVVGVIPFLNAVFDDEDSLSERFDRSEVKMLDIAIIRFLHISNFTDFDPFEQLEEVSVRYVSDPCELGDPDLIILPGSKNTLADLDRIKKNGLAGAIREKAADGSCVIGICGGFQMLGRWVKDPDNTEEGGYAEGLGLLPVDTVLENKKTTVNNTFRIAGATGILEGIEGTEAEGYEIHMGKTTPFEAVTEFTSEKTGYCMGNVYGTYIHGFFDKKEILTGVVERLAKARGKKIDTGCVKDYTDFINLQYDALAKALRESLDMDHIYRIMGLKDDNR